MREASQAIIKTKLWELKRAAQIDPNRAGEFQNALAHTDELLIKATDSECRTASLQVIDRLMRQEIQQFDRLFLVESAKDSLHPFRNPEWGMHSYFFVRSNNPDGSYTYYAGSPANIEPGETKVEDGLITSNSLKELIQTIQDRDDGIWPTEENIEHALQTEYQPPHEIPKDYLEQMGQSNTKKIQVFRVYHRTDGEIWPSNLPYQIIDSDKLTI